MFRGWFPFLVHPINLVIFVRITFIFSTHTDQIRPGTLSLCVKNITILNVFWCFLGSLQEKLTVDCRLKEFHSVLLLLSNVKKGQICSEQYVRLKNVAYVLWCRWWLHSSCATCVSLFPESKGEANTLPVVWSLTWEVYQYPLWHHRWVLEIKVEQQKKWRMDFCPSWHWFMSRKQERTMWNTLTPCL